MKPQGPVAFLPGGGKAKPLQWETQSISPGQKGTQAFRATTATGRATMQKRLRIHREGGRGSQNDGTRSLGSRPPSHCWCFQHLFGGGGVGRDHPLEE